MASDETRRVLKLFGVAVTDFEDAIARGASAGEVAKLDAAVTARMHELATLVERLRAASPR